MTKAKTLLLGSAASIALGLWSRYSRLEIQSTAPLAPSVQFDIPSPLRPQMSMFVASVSTPDELQPKPVDPTLLTIRTVLRKWLDARQNGAEEEASPLIDGLKLLLTNSNSAEIARSLSVEEQNTPFGLAALRRWMEIDPIRASTWVAKYPAATEDQVWVVASSWADDSEGLQEYIDLLPDGAWRQMFISETSSEALTRDPEAAGKLAQQLSPGTLQKDVLRAIAGHWINQDSDSALEWIAKVDDPKLREQLIDAAAKSSVVTRAR